eukprot:CAMPEP_0179951956 /NCGR_PEP_ID=MMETSP0983-20121128/23973_1 /TAXON_ID=483367 /ORGANISM="non described non described, Strain CCMP 2436" /LENGTH=104 /DNA_ID=CAMNT_0021862453 /DNA_START=148 /DNA_END=462 /DNA_ORIENTATION=-
MVYIYVHIHVFARWLFQLSLGRAGVAVDVRIGVVVNLRDEPTVAFAAAVAVRVRGTAHGDCVGAAAPSDISPAILRITRPVAVAKVEARDASVLLDERACHALL